jgi:hypothetical protein
MGSPKKKSGTTTKNPAAATLSASFLHNETMHDINIIELGITRSFLFYFFIIYISNQNIIENKSAT